MWLLRAIANERQLPSGGASYFEHGGLEGRSRARVHRVVPAGVRRRIAKSGRPPKCPPLRQALYNWFVDHRACVSTRISPRFLLLQARRLAGICVRVMAERKNFVPMPVLDGRWLRGFCNHHSIVLRQPNRRYKVSHNLALKRVRTMWSNVIRVRHLAVRLLGKDLADAIIELDEKPLHFNEAGSKSANTLAFKGDAFVGLHENYSGSRRRLSLVTCGVAAERLLRGLPWACLGFLVKGMSIRVLEGIEVPADMRVNLQYSESGSYKNAHFLKFLEFALEEWTDARAVLNDWQILILDVAASHLGEAVWNLCFSRGYVLLYHLGGTTAITQVPDTHLHGPFSKLYMHFEQMSFTKKQLASPGDISRTFREVFDDAVLTWRSMDPKLGYTGCMQTGVSVALDGSEDSRITGEAREFWYKIGMDEVRRACIAEVDKLVDSGEVKSFSDVKRVIQQPEADDIYREGAEFEPPLGSGELPYLTEADEKEIQLDQEEISCYKPLDLPVALPADGGEEREARLVLTELAALKDMSATARRLRLPTVVSAVEKRQTDLERQKTPIGSTSSKTNAFLNHYLRDVASKQHRAMTKARLRSAAVARAKAWRLRRVKLLKAKAKQAAKKTRLLRQRLWLLR